MAEKIYSYYVAAGDIGGVKARTRLSILTKITSVQAGTIPDAPDTIKSFEEAMAIIRKEFAGNEKYFDDNLQKAQAPAVKNVDVSVEYLRNHINIFSDLTAQRSLFIGDIETTCKRITESVVNAINVERSSIWLYDDAKSKIVCSDLYVREKREHSKGVELHAKDFPTYFKSIENERTLAAHDAQRDPRTAEFTEVYLKPLGITSMLDVPIWVGGKMVGVVCNEHVGVRRTWTQDEENFAYLMSGMVAMAMEVKK